MTAHSTDYPASKTMQSLIRVMLGVHLRHRPTAAKTRPSAEPSLQIARLHHELAEVGDLLVDAIRLETGYEEIDLSRAGAEELQQLRHCRRTVERLTEDYISIVSRWREAIDREAGSKEAR